MVPGRPAEGPQTVTTTGVPSPAREIHLSRLYAHTSHTVCVRRYSIVKRRALCRETLLRGRRAFYRTCFVARPPRITKDSRRRDHDPRPPRPPPLGAPVRARSLPAHNRKLAHVATTSTTCHVGGWVNSDIVIYLFIRTAARLPC